MNRFFTLLLAASCLTAVGQVPDYVPTDGLVAWYPLNDNGEDQWGEHNANYFSATPTTNRFGMPNRALNFEAGEEQFIRGDAQGLPIADRTISFWMKTTFEYEQTWPFGYGGGPLCVGRSTVLYFNSGDCNATGNVAHTAHCCTSVLNVSLDSSFDWTFWCYVNDDNGLRIYQNGVLIGGTGRAEDVQTSSSNFYIGSAVSFDGTSRYAEFTGALDDLGLWDRALSEDEIIELYSATESVTGCVDEMACNYNGASGVISSPESCDYSCCPGPGCCHEGTIWDSNLQQCIVANPADINLDGCVQLNDLLDLLSAYGGCEAEASPWLCGDPLEYQGYDYETVQIGEQCWFAENLRAENYRNGDEIPAGLSDSEWENTSSGAVAVYGEGSSSCVHQSPSGDACDETWSLNEYGRLYNWYAVDDARGLCPNNWYLPSHNDWTVLTNYLGGAAEGAGAHMKTDFGWDNSGNGNNSSGFRGLPNGGRHGDGVFYDAGIRGFWWSSSPYSSTAWWSRILSFEYDNVFQTGHVGTYGLSIRCIKDTE